MTVQRAAEVGALLALVLLCGMAQGQETVKPETVADAWQYKAAPYLWVPQIRGHATADGVPTPANAAFSDVLDDLKYAASGRVEAWRDRLGFTFDALLVGLDAPTNVPVPGGGPRIHADVSFKLAYAECGLGYRLMHTALGADEARLITVDLLAGARYMYNKVRVRVDGIADPDYKEQWVDPFVGGRARVGITDKLAMSCRFTTGGWGVGSSSEHVYDILGMMEYQLSERTALQLGYRYFDIKKRFNSTVGPFGLNRNELDLRLDGPYIGVGILF